MSLPLFLTCTTLPQAKDYFGSLASKTGRSIPATSAEETLGGSAERGMGLLGTFPSTFPLEYRLTTFLDKAAGNVGNTTGTAHDTIRDTSSTLHDTHRGAASTEENILPQDHHGGMNLVKAFTSKGAVGRQFNPEGPLGSIPQAVGGPFDKEGIGGKQFTNEGVIGGWLSMYSVCSTS